MNEQLNPFDRVTGVLKTKHGERVKVLSPFTPDGRVKTPAQARLDQVSPYVRSGGLKGGLYVHGKGGVR